MNAAELLLRLVQSAGVIVMAAFILLSWGAFRKLVLKQTNYAEKAVLIVFFGAFGILGTYLGVPILGGIINIRAIGVITGGLFGGPVVGIGAGLIAGGHRWLIDLGGLSALPCGFSTFLEGAAAGIISIFWKHKVLDWKRGALFAAGAESVHMLITLILARPFIEAAALVRAASIPMIMVNTLGVGLFVQVVRFVLRERERRASNQAHKALDIANRTVSHLRSGLNLESAHATAGIIYKQLSIAAVAITNTKYILAHVGQGSDHHLQGHPIKVMSTLKVMETGRSSYLKSSKDIGCWDELCPLQSAVIVPLRKGEEILGTLALYGDRNILLYDVDFQMARGLARLFSTQLELEDIQVQTHMLARAEIRRLQSQINPHFLFNSLNTIASFCRTDMAKARELLRELSRYLRNNLRGHKELVSVGQEMDHVNSYVAIERARFGERIKVSTDMQPGSEQWQIPPLTIQPLVENAIRHGLKNLEAGGEVHIATQSQNGELRITVTDNGQGMTPEIINKVLDENCPSDQGNGVGLRNVEQRLKQLYGKKYGLNIVSQKSQGTTITLRIPRRSYLL